LVKNEDQMSFTVGSYPSENGQGYTQSWQATWRLIFFFFFFSYFLALYFVCSVFFFYWLFFVFHFCWAAMVILAKRFWPFKVKAMTHLCCCCCSTVSLLDSLTA
jgi:hypothetical protein